MVDGVNVAEIMSVTYDPYHSQYHQSAVTAVVECPKGGAVWVECQQSNSQVIRYDHLTLQHNLLQIKIKMSINCFLLFSNKFSVINAISVSQFTHFFGV